MPDALRKQIADAADTVVVKVGTRVLTKASGALDLERVAAIAEQLATLADGGRRVALVSSGAVGAGVGRLGLTKRPSDLAQLQATAAVGQSLLIECYNQALQSHGRHAAQVLLTVEDLNDRSRYLNARNTLRALFEFGAVPIVNENDTVRVDELQRNVGDNDRLAAVVTNLLRAPLLVLLSDVDGLYDRDPALPDAQLIPVVDAIDDTILALAGGQPDETGALRLSTGGMASKLRAAQMAASAGENVIVANGRTPGVLLRIVAGAPVGTLFPATGGAVSSRKRWIGWTAHPRGSLTLDAGATRAIVDSGRSLLAVGVVAVEGTFDKGDIVSLRAPAGQEVARGLSNYRSSELARIIGQPTDRISDLLGHCPYEEVVHRDNLTLLR